MISGNSSEIDIQKVRKHMKSGKKRTTGEFVTRQATWPEQMLSLNAPGFKKKEHHELTFAEFIDGMLAKFLTETLPQDLDSDLSNKLIYLRELVAMQYSIDFKHVLAINERFLDGYESEHFDWSNWSRIDAYLKCSCWPREVRRSTQGSNFRVRGGHGFPEEKQLVYQVESRGVR